MATSRWRREAGAGAGRARREGKRKGTRDGEKGGGAPGWGGVVTPVGGARRDGGVAMAARRWRRGSDGRQGSRNRFVLASSMGVDLV